MRCRLYPQCVTALTYFVTWLKFIGVTKCGSTRFDTLAQLIRSTCKLVPYNCLMVYNGINSQTLKNLCSIVTFVSYPYQRQSRTTNLDLLHNSRSCSANFERAFSAKEPTIWNIRRIIYTEQKRNATCIFN